MAMDRQFSQLISTPQLSRSHDDRYASDQQYATDPQVQYMQDRQDVLAQFARVWDRCYPFQQTFDL
jgi:hypothetical protein